MKDQTESSQPFSSFLENIALTFSGGGFRAASFSLGVLSYLDQVQYKGSSLLSKVKGLSTVSGGTITGAAYAQSQHRNQHFDAFYHEMVNFLSGERILDKALANMENAKVWKKTYKKHSLINAFSLAYVDDLSITMGDLMKNAGHLEEICFNATDFSFGLAFRFQINGDFGNYRLKVIKGGKEDIKIADAVASSSCFPMGFAPMIMPDDYLDHDSEAYEKLKTKDYFKDGIGIMDGGIVDNQGIGSTMLADKRRSSKGKQPYDLVLVCDVASYKMPPWEQDTETGTNKDTIGGLVTRIIGLLTNTWLAWVCTLVGIGGTVLAALQIAPSWLYMIGGLGLASGGILFVFLTVSSRAVNWVKRKLEKVVPALFLRKVKYFDNLKVNLLRRMVEERATSGFKMINEVFLKQIRRLNYQLFYANEELEDRRATALIYELTKEQFEGRESTEIKGEQEIKEVERPSQAIFDCAHIASNMGTTLWFSPEDEKKLTLENLIACGRFTTCYSLINYLTKLEDSPDAPKGEIEVVKSLLIKDWNEFVKDPFWKLPASE